MSLPGLLDKVLSQKGFRHKHGCPYFRKGVSLLMFCQKFEGLRLGSASMKTCCWGSALGSVGCFCRIRKS